MYQLTKQLYYNPHMKYADSYSFSVKLWMQLSWSDGWLGSGRHLRWPRLARRRDLSQGGLCVPSVGSLQSSYTSKVAVDIIQNTSTTRWNSLKV